MANLFKTPKAPTPAAPAPMPDVELAGKEARMQAMRDALARKGRASTILTGRPRVANAGSAAPSFDTYAAANLAS